MGFCAELRDCAFFVGTENTGRVIKKLETHGYEPELDDDGNIIGIGFVGDKLSNNEDSMFEEVAPFVKSGSFIEMEGEDRSRWRWTFKDGTVKEQIAKIKIIWSDEDDLNGDEVD